jgi:hypothetical protein
MILKKISIKIIRRFRRAKRKDRLPKILSKNIIFQNTEGAIPLTPYTSVLDQNVSKGLCHFVC